MLLSVSNNFLGYVIYLFSFVVLFIKVISFSFMLQKGKTSSTSGGSNARLGSEESNDSLVDMYSSPLADFHVYERLQQGLSHQVCTSYCYCCLFPQKFLNIAPQAALYVWQWCLYVAIGACMLGVAQIWGQSSRRLGMLVLEKKKNCTGFISIPSRMCFILFWPWMLLFI